MPFHFSDHEQDGGYTSKACRPGGLPACFPLFTQCLHKSTLFHLHEITCSYVPGMIMVEAVDCRGNSVEAAPIGAEG